MARIFPGLLGRNQAKETYERTDQSAELAKSIRAANEDRSRLRATIQLIAEESERRDRSIREDARAAAAKLKLRRPGLRKPGDQESEQSVEQRHEAAMQRGLARMGKLTATFKLDLDEGTLKRLAARSVAWKKQREGGERAASDGGELAPAQPQPQEREDHRAPFVVPLSDLATLLQERFGNLDVINKTIPGSRDSSSRAPLDWHLRAGYPDGESDQPTPEEDMLDVGTDNERDGD